MERADGAGMATAGVDVQEADPTQEKPRPVRARARTSSITQRDRLLHNGPSAQAGNAKSEQRLKCAAGGSRRGTETSDAPRRPLSLEVKPQHLRVSHHQSERKVLQPPWRCGAPSPPVRSLTSPSLGPGGWMRRSESTCTVNSTVPPMAGRGRMRPATSLPHIARGIGSATLPTPSTPRGPCLLVALRPTNLEQERQTFFQSDYKYEPQFEYASPDPISNVLERYKEGSGLFLSQVC